MTDYLYNLPNATTGPDQILVQTVAQVPSFTGLLLASVFLIMFLGGIGRQKLRTGTADYALWSVVASLSTFMVALLMTVIEGLIRLDLLAVVIVITIFSGVWLFLDRRQGEL